MITQLTTNESLDFFNNNECYEECIEFIKSRIEFSNKKLLDLEEFFEGIHNSNQQKEFVENNIAESIAFYEKTLIFLDELKKLSESKYEDEFEDEDEDEDEDETLESEENGNPYREPKDMIRPHLLETYRKCGSIKNLLDWLFEEKIDSATTDEIANILYETRSDDEYGRAKNLIASQLRAGAEEGRWQKLGMGHFACNDFDFDDSENETLEEETKDSSWAEIASPWET